MNTLRKIEIARSSDDSAPAEDPFIGLATIFRIIWSRKLVVIAFTCVALVLAILYTASNPRMFVAEATILLDERDAELVDIDRFGRSVVAAQSITTELEILQSRELATRVVQRLSLLADPEFNPALAPDFFSVSSTLKNWINEAVDWVRDRIDAYRPASESLDWAPTAGEDEERGDSGDPVVASRIEELSSTAEMLLSAVDVTPLPDSYIFKAYVQSISPEKAALIANAFVETYIAERYDARTNSSKRALGTLRARVLVLQDEVERAEQALQEYKASTELVSADELALLNKDLKDLRTWLSELESPNSPNVGRLASSELSRGQQAQNLRYRIEVLRSQIKTQSDELVQVMQREREVEASVALYEFALAKLKELAVQQGLQQAGARILSKAAIPSGPSASKAPRNILLAGVLGFLTGTGLVLVHAGTRTRLQTADELERLSRFPVLAEVPEAGFRRKHTVRAIASEQFPEFSEAVRDLRTKLLMGNSGRIPKSIVLTSALPGEGKTTQALALSHSIAMLQKRVLLVDCDLRSSELSRRCGFGPDAAGLGSALIERRSLETFVQHLSALGVDVVAAGKTHRNPTDLFASNGVADALERARHEYDLIVLDSPAVLTTPDAKLIAAHADTVLLVVRSDHTKYRDVKASLNELRKAQVLVDGFILNGLRRARTCV